MVPPVHFRVGDLSRCRTRLRELFNRRENPVRPSMAAGDDAGATILTGEIDQGDHGRQLQLRRWLGNVTPHRLVTVEKLLVGPRSAL
jgi:hypothetical protein